MASQLGASSRLGPSFCAADYDNDGKYHVLVAASGSVATIKLPNIVTALSQRGDVSIRIILTASAHKFLLGQSSEQPDLQTIRAIPHVDGIYLDEDEWRTPWTRGANILHIELRRWAHCLLIAPLSANTLAKITMGLSDNLLLSVVRAWDWSRSATSSGELIPRPRIFVAPAMNTVMWRHPITENQISVLEGDWGFKGEESQGWFTVIRPMQKALACGDVGDGAMEDWKKIVNVVEQYFEQIRL
ncbi:phosphopantothenoylcysteine decarboxylase [Ascosphaera apis ARSEF 7405]|uniref:Phosphopantothenoylcysteine decarboxylase n=1 Tax=Ascosphaera apis ARSEF 7405 TaxID=392613 RepID=A0A168CSB4_9EURO|nr:phosphopantothenoylcysteine decarboxylase [Ascosphaera apis ARSEF 7405]